MNHKLTYCIENSESFQSLKIEADKSPRKRALKMLHFSHDEELHSMINVFKKGTYVQPHCHLIKKENGKTVKKGESFFALEGEGRIILFDENGSITEIISLKATEKTMVWIPAHVYHTVVALTEYFIIFENKTGPWKEGEDKFFHKKFPSENLSNEQIVKDWELVI